MERLIETIVGGVALGGVYALLALGFIVIYKSSKVFNFAVGVFLTMGAFIFMVCTTNLGLPLWLGVLMTLAFAVALGFFIERVFLRPMIGQSILSIIMMTLAISLLISAIVVLIWKGHGYAYSAPLFGTGSISLGKVTLAVQHVASLGIALALFGMLSYYFKFTMSGLGMRAVAEDHQVARAKGVDAKRVFAYTWVICCIVCVIGGILLGDMVGVGRHLEILGLKAIPVVLVAGLESVPGALVAGPVIGVLESLTAEYLSIPLGIALEEVVPFVVLLLFLIFKPYGLFGLTRIERI